MKLLETLEEEFVLTEGKYNFVTVDHVEDDSSLMTEKMGKMINRDQPGKTMFPKDDVERRELLQQGWRDPVKINKEITDENGVKKVKQDSVDPRDWEEKYQKEGWELGWPYFRMVSPTGKKKYVSKKVYEKRKSQGWRDYEQRWVYLPITLKNGQEDYQNKEIDVGEIQSYLAQGWKLGKNNGLKQTKPDDFYKSFSIMLSNTKLGKVGNFSLTPVASCPSGVRCAKEGCYALRCYKQYPDVRLAWDKNMELVKNHVDWLVPDINNFLQNGPGKGLNKFRWHVAGDLMSVDQLAAINQIARDNPGVLFWLYTKNYDLVNGFSPASNLVIILSAWNDYQLDKIESMHKQFPVAYLDDWDHKNLIPSDDEAFICPCADDKSSDTVDDKHCETCQTHGKRVYGKDTHPCYMLRPGESLIFRKH